MQCVFHHLQAVLKVIVFEEDEKADEAINGVDFGLGHLKRSELVDD